MEGSEDGEANSYFWLLAPKRSEQKARPGIWATRGEDRHHFQMLKKKNQ